MRKIKNKNKNYLYHEKMMKAVTRENDENSQIRLTNSGKSARMNNI